MIGHLEELFRELGRANQDPKRAHREAGGWREQAYNSSLGVFLSQLLPVPDLLCPTDLRSQFWEFFRAVMMLAAYWYLLRNLFSVEGWYSGMDALYGLRSL